MKTYNYPQQPHSIPEDAIKPSLKFNLQVKKVMALLFLFACIYLTIIGLTFGLMALLGYLGIQIITHVFNIWSILAGLGLISIGVMVFVFVIKFLFAQHKEVNENRVEIFEDEHPALFDFIRKISKETGTRFPKHIYLMPDVNAYVFFDSSFWSMIFPVRKNLVIGLGLINMVNLSEFKSIIAHEFGHFSQKSMRTGSYVYHTHKVLYNMLYENKGYISALGSWAGIHAIFAFCANVTLKIVQGIQWILRQAFMVVNKQYMGLSREMEFHADAVAASVSGSNNMVHALRRVEFADSCYNSVIDSYNRWLAESYKGENVYNHQLVTATFIAKANKFDMSPDGLPLLHDIDTRFKSFNKVNIENQWASHPSRSQREASLNRLAIQGEVIEDSAWALLEDKANLQTLFTNQLYKDVKFERESILLNEGVFRHKYEAEKSGNIYADYYEGYYDYRFIRTFDLSGTAAVTQKIDTAFFQSHKDLFKQLEAAKGDEETLKQIQDPKHKIRSFDYDGVKYKRRNAPVIQQQVQQQIVSLEQSLTEHDQQVYAYCFQQANLMDTHPAEELRRMYQQYFKVNVLVKNVIDYLNTVPPLIHPFYNVGTLEEARQLSTKLESEMEILKGRVEVLQSSFADIKALEKYPMPAMLQEFKEKQWRFINAQQKLNGENIQALWDVLQTVSSWLNDVNFALQRDILEYQLQWLR